MWKNGVRIFENPTRISTFVLVILFDVFLIRFQVCDDKDPEYRHPITNVIDGTNSRWQSPTLQNGRRFEWVTITLDLKQVKKKRDKILLLLFSCVCEKPPTESDGMMMMMMIVDNDDETKEKHTWESQKESWPHATTTTYPVRQLDFLSLCFYRRGIKIYFLSVSQGREREKYFKWKFVFWMKKK